MKIALKNEVRSMVRWALRQIINKMNDEDFTNPNELKNILQEVWNELVEDGEIRLTNSNN